MLCGVQLMIRLQVSLNLYENTYCLFEYFIYAFDLYYSR